MLEGKKKASAEGGSPPQDLEVSPRNRLYLLVILLRLGGPSLLNIKVSIGCGKVLEQSRDEKCPPGATGNYKERSEKTIILFQSGEYKTNVDFTTGKPTICFH